MEDLQPAGRDEGSEEEGDRNREALALLNAERGFALLPPQEGGIDYKE
jgi:hypothetical protein